MAEDRENGLYWIRLRTIDVSWEVAKWNKEFETWRLLESQKTYSHVTSVGPRILSPKKEIHIRKAGFYWVKFNIGDYWTIVYWPHNPRGPWHSVGSSRTFTDKDIDKIGPRLSPPEEE